MSIRTSILVSVVFVFGLFSSLSAQVGGPCPTANSTNQRIALSSDLVCTVPQVYGGGGLVGPADNGPMSSTTGFHHDVHFQNSGVASLGPLNSEIGTQISQLPLTAPAAGFIFSFNSSLGVVSRQTQNFGPILSDRADTIGRHKLFVGLSYQYFNFDKIGSVNLRRFGAVFRHETNDAQEVCGTPLPPGLHFTGCPGIPVFENDFITATNGIGLTVNQVTATADLGLTNRFDVGVAIPILTVHMSASSDAVVNSYESPRTFPNALDGFPPVVNGDLSLHQFATPAAVPGEIVYAPGHAAFFRHNSSRGIGDVVFRTKYQVIRGERAGLSAGVDVHTPTGDAMNFLGSGTWGTRPFLTFSYAGRVAPHASMGYQINGNSILGGDINTFTKDHLPNILNYTAGFDAGVVRRLSLSFDYLGQTLFSEKGAMLTTYTAAQPCSVCATPPVSSAPDLIPIRQNINQSSLSLGGKLNPAGKLLVIMNVLIRVNDAGLHYKPAPMIGMSYTF